MDRHTLLDAFEELNSLQEEKHADRKRRSLTESIKDHINVAKLSIEEIRYLSDYNLEALCRKLMQQVNASSENYGASMDTRKDVLCIYEKQSRVVRYQVYFGYRRDERLEFEIKLELIDKIISKQYL